MRTALARTAAAALALSSLAGCSTSSIGQASPSASIVREAADRAYGAVQTLCVLNGSGHEAISYSFGPGLWDANQKPLGDTSGTIPRNGRVCASRYYGDGMTVPVTIQIPGVPDAGNLVLTFNTSDFNASIPSINGTSQGSVQLGASVYIQSGDYRIDVTSGPRVYSEYPDANYNRWLTTTYTARVL
jgi:hypothetical protein